MSYKRNSLLTASLLSIGLCSTGSAFAVGGGATVVWADPVPVSSDPAICTGLGYEWTVTLSKGQKASFVNHVGAKSWNEPPPFYEPPYTGWTHTSNWVALDLKKPAKVTIQLERQQGVLTSSIGTNPTTGSPMVVYTAAGNQLYPAFSLYANWEETGCEDHRYNNAGPTPWATSLEFLANQPNANGWAKATLVKWLPAGKYSLALGGANVSFCAPTDTCYVGRHGYRASITAE